MNRSYWTKTLEARLSRRRALTATGGIAAAALLAACGGSSSGGGDKNATASLLTPISDETKSVKRGGTFKFLATRDPGGIFEPHTAGTGSQDVIQFTYSTLFHIKDGYMTASAGEIEGDVVDTYEVTPDKLTMKINPNVHFTPQPPVNGRSVDAKDVTFSADRMKSISSRRMTYFNDLNQSAPITSITATDDQTVVIKMARPYSVIYSLLTGSFAGDLFIAPKEAANPDVINLRNTVRGSGPWYLSDEKQGIGYQYKRNPAFKQDKRGDIPFMDQIDLPIVLEYAAGLAQFRTGAVYNFPVKQEEVLGLKQDVPTLTMMKSDVNISPLRAMFGVAPTSNFKDVRVRQAFTYTWDRDLFLDSFANVSKFKSQGVVVDTYWEGAARADFWKGWFIDARDKDFGPNAKYFKQDLAEAKKLLAAAGMASPLPVNIHHPAQGADFGNPPYFNALDVILAIVDDSKLFKLTRDPLRYQSEFLPKYTSGKGQFDDVAFMLGGVGGDPVTALYAHYHPAGQFPVGTDDKLVSYFDAALAEFDSNKRREIVRDIQRYEGEAEHMPRISSASGLQVFWPVLRNMNVWQGGTGRMYTNVFLDPSQPPLKGA